MKAPVTSFSPPRCLSRVSGCSITALLPGLLLVTATNQSVVPFLTIVSPLPIRAPVSTSLKGAANASLSGENQILGSYPHLQYGVVPETTWA